MSIRVFISYSSRYQPEVDILAKDLTQRGVQVWVATQGIGTGDEWQKKIRQSIQNVDVIIFVGTPEAAVSPFVLAELELARDYSKPIYPVWLSGNIWSECAPLQIISMQHIDLRGPKRAEGMERLAISLGLASRSTTSGITGSILPFHPPTQVSSSPPSMHYSNNTIPSSMSVLSDNPQFMMVHRRQKAGQLVQLQRPVRGVTVQPVICTHCKKSVRVFLQSRRGTQRRFSLLVFTSALYLFGFLGWFLGILLGNINGSSALISQVFYGIIFVAVIIASVFAVGLVKPIPKLQLRWLLPASLEQGIVTPLLSTHQFMNSDGTPFSEIIKQALRKSS